MRQLVRTRPVAVISLAAIVAAMAAASIPLASPAHAATSTVLSVDFEDGTWTGLQKSGLDSGALSVIDFADSTGDKVLLVEGRVNDYDGVSTEAGLLHEGTTYTVTAKVRLVDGHGEPHLMKLVETSSYQTIGSELAVTDSAWTTLTGSFTASEATTRVYIGTAGAEGESYDYLIDDVLITAESAAAECEPLVHYDFDGPDADPWYGVNATISITQEDSHAGAGSMLVTGRTEGWNGPRLNVDTLFAEGSTYTVTGWVKLIDGTDGSQDIKITAITDDGGEEYYEVAVATGVTDDEWVRVSGDFTVPGTPKSIYVESNDPSGEFLVDEVTITGTCGQDPEPCEGSIVTHTSIDFEDSTLGSWGPSGSPDIDFVEDPEDSSNTVVALTERGEGWHTIQSAQGVFEEGVLYTATARVRTDGDNALAHFTYNEPGDSPRYDWVGTAPTGTDSEWIEISGSFTPGENAADGKIYIELTDTVDDLHFDFLVDDIVITYLAPCGSGPAPGTVLLNADFEDGTLQGWVAREAGNGPHTVEVIDTDSHGGHYAAIITDRTSQGSGIGFDVTGVLEPGTQYEVSAWVKFVGSPVDDIVFTAQTGPSAFATLGTFTGVSNSEWTEVTGKFTFASGTLAFLYFETPWEGEDVTGNTTPFLIDDIQIRVPEAVIIEDLTPIKSTTTFPVGVAIDQRETRGAGAQLLLKHFNQITPENYMKPEAWYSGPFTWGPNAAEIDSLMDFAQDNDLGLYGHVLVWHSQTPAWFFQKSPGDSTPLTTSPEDKQILRERLREHIFNVAEYLAQWGEYGGGDNPLIAFDVVNEVIDDSAAYADGMRRSEWYRILGEEFVHLAFQYADEAFNDEYAAAAADRPVKLFINDYNTEQSGKRGRYLALVDRLVDGGAPIDGIGHQFHVSLAMPVENLEQALSDASAFGLLQAVTEFDVTTGVPESQAKFIDQGYYYRDAFEIFRAYQAQMFSVTVWGLNDSRSWRDSSGGPLVFDDDFQAKPAYYGIVQGHTGGAEPDLPARLRTADVFGATVPLDGSATSSPEWERLPLHQISGATAWQARWNGDTLTVYVTVADPDADALDGVDFVLDGTSYVVTRAAGGPVPSERAEFPGGWSVVAELPLSGAGIGSTVELDVRAVDDGDVVGWNTYGEYGTLTLVEELSFTEIGEAQILPKIDGRKDWIWLHAAKVTAQKHVEGSGGALGTFYHLWDGNTLYVYAEIADPTVDVSGSDPWIQDSVEIYVDAGNYKNGSYRYDDTQIRINADNVVSFGTGDEGFQAARVESATKRIPGGYIVEASISLLEEGGLGSFHGVDFQVNDATNGARTAIRNWADPTGAGYQSTARWGVAQLVESAPLDIPDVLPLADEDLTADNALCVSAPDTAKQGETITVQLCPEYAGDTVDVYVYSDPQHLVTGAVSGAATISVTIPANLAAGLHKIAVYDADGFLIGWTSISIQLAGGAMADTGAHITGALFVAVALLVGGAAVLTSRRRFASLLA